MKLKAKYRGFFFFYTNIFYLFASIILKFCRPEMNVGSFVKGLQKGDLLNLKVEQSTGQLCAGLEVL